jgi:hypothetical protein
MTEERCAKGRESPEPPLGRTRPGLSTAQPGGKIRGHASSGAGSGRVRPVDDHSDE